MPITAIVFGLALLFLLNGRPIPAEFNDKRGMIPLFHLWFLYYLTLYYALMLLARRVLPGLGKFMDRLAGPLTGRLGFVLLALPTATVLALLPHWKAWFGIATPLSFIPEIAPLVEYGVAFTLGWILHRQQPRLQAIAGNWVQHLLLGLAGTGLLLHFIGVLPTLNTFPTQQVPLAFLLALP